MFNGCSYVADEIQCASRVSCFLVLILIASNLKLHLRKWKLLSADMKMNFEVFKFILSYLQIWILRFLNIWLGALGEEEWRGSDREGKSKEI